MDRRTTPFSGRVAHVSLRGQVAAETFSEGAWHRVTAPVADLDRAPGGARDRQVIRGDRFLVLDRQQGHAYGQREKDGYCGWLPEAVLGPDTAVTHAVAAASSHLYPEARVQAREVMALPFGAQVLVTGSVGSFAQTPGGFIPAAHLRPLDQHFADPVAVAEMFLGTPYLWGGNSRAGLDCSGLAQAALLACGIPCPGDSDLQQALGRPLDAAEAPARGDLVFWKGHVALVSAPDEILHATGAFMSVVRESLSGAIARIEANGGGPVTAQRRLPAAA